jgi:hypothetical protein
MIGIITDSATNTPEEYLKFDRIENVTLSQSFQTLKLLLKDLFKRGVMK